MPIRVSEFANELTESNGNVSHRIERGFLSLSHSVLRTRRETGVLFAACNPRNRPSQP